MLKTRSLFFLHMLSPLSTPHVICILRFKLILGIFVMIHIYFDVKSLPAHSAPAASFIHLLVAQTVNLHQIWFPHPPNSQCGIFFSLAEYISPGVWFIYRHDVQWLEVEQTNQIEFQYCLKNVYRTQSVSKARNSAEKIEIEVFLRRKLEAIFEW